jgi:hypothetical protein
MKAALRPRHHRWRSSSLPDKALTMIFRWWLAFLAGVSRASEASHHQCWRLVDERRIVFALPGGISVQTIPLAFS